MLCCLRWSGGSSLMFKDEELKCLSRNYKCVTETVTWWGEQALPKSNRQLILQLLALFLTFFFNLFFYWRITAFQNLFSLQPQHESAIGIHISPPFWSSLPSPAPSHPLEPLYEFPEPYSKFPLALYFTYGNVSFRVTLSLSLTLSSPPSVPVSLFSMSLSPLLPCT